MRVSGPVGRYRFAIVTRTKLALAVLGGVLLWVLIAYGVLRLAVWLMVGTAVTDSLLGAAVAGAYRPEVVRR